MCSIAFVFYGTVRALDNKTASGNHIVVAMSVVFYIISYAHLSVRAEIARGFCGQRPPLERTNNGDHENADGVRDHDERANDENV